jgi:hypothetical protein
MRSVTAIEPSWLVELVPQLFKFEVAAQADDSGFVPPTAASSSSSGVHHNKSSSTRLVGEAAAGNRKRSAMVGDASPKPMKKKNFMVD